MLQYCLLLRVCLPFEETINKPNNQEDNPLTKEKERILELIAETINLSDDQNDDSGIDYAVEYQKQTGKDLATGEYVTQ